MKAKLIILTFLPFLFFFFGKISNFNNNTSTKMPPPCPVGDVILIEQDDVDTWIANNSGCNLIQGNLQIGGNASGSPTHITDISGLMGLTEVTGDVMIKNNVVLDNLSGLDQLETIGGKLIISYNFQLQDLKELSNLTTLNYLEVYDHNRLKNLEGLENLTSVGGQFILSKNDSLNNITSLSNLQTVDTFEIEDNINLTSLNGLEGLTFANDFLIIGNDELQGFQGLNNLQTVAGNLGLFGELETTNCEGLSNLNYVGGELSISGNGFIDLQGLENLDSIGVGLSVRNTGVLKTLEGLDNLKSIGSTLGFQHNDSLSDITALSNLQHFDNGTINWHYNRSLKNFEGLEGVTNLKDLVLTSNFDLENFEGLNNLTFIENNLNIFSNSALLSLSGLENLESTNDLVITGSPLLTSLQPLSGTSVNTYMVLSDLGLTNLNGLENVTSLSTNLRISNCSSLENLNGLHNLTSIGTYISITYNNLLINLEGLTNLSSINNHLSVENCDNLINVEGMDNLTSIGTHIYFNSNPALQNFKGLEGIEQIGGNVRVYANASLADFSGLDNLVSVGGDFELYQHPSLIEVNGFEKLETIGAGFRIFGNDLLENIDAFPSLYFIGENLRIYNNPELVICNSKFICIHLLDSDLITLYGNGVGCNDPSLLEDGCVNGKFIGKLTFDENENCIDDNSEVNLTGWKIIASSNDFTNIAFTDNQGEYQLNLIEGNYSIGAFPPSDIWFPCPNTSNYEIESTEDTFYVDFSAQPIVECPILSVELNSNRIRTCRETLFFLDWCNTGTTDAEDAYVEVFLNSFFTIIDAPIPYTIDTTNGNNKAIFQLGDIPVGECSNFSFTVFVSCDAIIDQTLCATARIYPDSLCALPASNWSGGDLYVEGLCETDGVKFKIRNEGTGDMTEPSNYFILENGLPFSTGEVLLNAGEETELIYSLNGSTYRIELSQVPNYPQVTLPVATVESWCIPNNSFSTGHVLDFPVEDYAEKFDRHCLMVTGSYDPNDKQGFPNGYGPDHLIEPNTEIEYLVRFQNTGNDTAFLVVILDTLSEYFDLNTIELGGSSHPFKFQVLEDNVLEFRFENIMLPDSFVNEPTSNGFFTYRIQQQMDLPLGTELRNSAAIYFDFNDPIITNETHHLLGTFTILQVEVVELCEGDIYNDVAYYESVSFTDTSFIGIFEKVTGLQIIVHPNYNIEIDTVLNLGNSYNGIFYESDTTLQEVLESQYGCDSIVTVNVLINSVGINNLNGLTPKVSIIPNPFHNYTVVKIEEVEFQKGRIEIFDLFGSMINSFSFNEKQFKIEREGLSSGIYFYRIILDEFLVEEGKLIIQ
jgi:hypothetical protein